MKTPELRVETRFYGDPRDIREVIVFGIEEESQALSGNVAEADRIAGRIASQAIERGDFRGRKEQTISLFSSADVGPKRIILVGLGKAEAYCDETMRRSLTAGLKEAARMEISEVNVDLDSFTLGRVNSIRAVELAAETSPLALWRYLRYRTEIKDEEKSKLEKVRLLWTDADDPGEVEAVAIRAGAVARGACYARDLVSRPSNELYPESLAQEAREIGQRHGFQVEVLDESGLGKIGLNALLAVGAGSARPPRLIVVDTSPKSAAKPVVLVGKGITFDSGGISIKPATGMEEMKGDMAGAAAVLGALDVLGDIGWQGRVVGVVPAAENVLGPSAQHPGDIWSTYQGTTVEVLNTDAEGRLALADALAYAVKNFEPSQIVDLATLTGACVVALGHVTSGLFCTDDKLCDAIQRAGDLTGERVWRLPLYEEYEELLKSEIADLKNIGDGSAGAIVAAFFLKRFVGEIPWAHIDIAGTFWQPKAKSYLPAGPTGVGVRLLVEALTRQL